MKLSHFLSIALVLSVNPDATPVGTPPVGELVTTSEGKTAVKVGSPMASYLMGALTQRFGTIVIPFLAGVLTAFLFPITPTPEEVYNNMWGYIQTQVNDAIVSKSKAVLTQDLVSLTVNINGQVTGYLTQLQILNQTPASLTALLKSKGGSLSVPPDTVDLAMKGVDTIVSSSLSWYSALPLDVANPAAFVLASTTLGACLHTKQFKIEDGTEIIMDNQCDLNNLADKTFSLGADNRLLLRTSQGLKCVAYNSKRGDDVKKHLAIFDIKSNQCQLGRPITLHRGADGVLALFDGFGLICVNGRTGAKNANSLQITNLKKKQCKKGTTLSFDDRIPIPLVDSSAGGATGSNLTPAISFEELSVQLFYFPKIATVHLLALKEIYLYGNLKAEAQSEFHVKVGRYQVWLQKVIPLVTAYSGLMGIDSSAAIQDAQILLSALSNATLSAAPSTWVMANS